MRKTISPGSNERDRKLIEYPQREGWANGTINDPPASNIPENSLHYAENAIVYPNEITSRTGSRLWTSERLPPLAGRSGYSAIMIGNIITCDQNAFSEEDVGNYFVWPGATDQEHCEIMRYISSDSVEVADSLGNRPITEVGCFVRGKMNAWKWHSILKRFLFQLGSELWLVNLEMDTWQEVLIISRDKLFNAKSDCKQFDNYTFKLFNSNGIFTVDCENTTPVAYKCNVPIPAIQIPEVDQSELTKYQYGYLYGAARLSGYDLFRDRLQAIKIEMETGTNTWDDAGKDYSDIWTEKAIGVEGVTYGVLTCLSLIAPFSKASDFAVITDGTFFATINGIGPYEVFCDFSDCDTMSDVAATIQASMRDYWPDATCVFDVDHFVISAGKTEYSTIDYLTDGVDGTNIATIIFGTEVAGALIENPYLYQNKIVGPLYVPIVNNTNPQEYQWHLTHFPIYRTKDKENLSKQGTSEQRLNDPERFVWVKDLRMCAAFFAKKESGHVIAQIGEFELADVGTVIEWEDGTRNTITAFISSTEVQIGDEYYDVDSEYQAAAIGDGRVLRAIQVNQTVTRINGDTFKSNDVGKTINWSTGYRSIITAYVDENTITVEDSNDKDEQGITLDPVSRYFNDSIGDDVLRTRESSLLCSSRFLEPMWNCNVGVIVPGYMITAQRNNNIIQYCQLTTGYKYLAGYHNEGYQYSETITDDIQLLLAFSGKFVALCSNKTWSGPTNMSDFVTVGSTGVAVSVLSGIDILDGNIGCFDWGSVQEIQDGLYRMITSENGNLGLRDFDGYKFGTNLLEVARVGQTNWMDSFKELQKATCSIYDGNAGYIVWGLNNG